MTREVFEARVRETIRTWGDLLDPHAAALLVVDECGVSPAEWTRVRDLEANAEVSLRGEVTAISPVRTFDRRDGSQGRVCNLTVSDGTGSVRVVLWDDDVDLVDRTVRSGSVVRCLDCYVRLTNFGLEVSRGKFGALVVEGTD